MMAVMAVCASAQQGLGGQGGSGGQMAYQSSVPPPFAITTAALPSVAVNTAYSQTIAAVNGVSPLSWTIMLGSLPPGLTLDSATGVISGTPTALGDFTFTVLVTDSTSPTHLTASQQLTISVTCSSLSIVSNPLLPPALVGTAYQFQFNSSGGQG